MKNEDTNRLLSLIRKLITVGVVNSVNPGQGTVNVLFQDRDDTISEELPLLSSEYNIPQIGQQVLCVFLGNGVEQGFCLGTPFSEKHKPPVNDENMVVKSFSQDTFIMYNKSTNELEIHSPNPLKIVGGISVEGNVVATETMSASTFVSGS